MSAYCYLQAGGMRTFIWKKLTAKPVMEEFTHILVRREPLVTTDATPFKNLAAHCLCHCRRPVKLECSDE